MFSAKHRVACSIPWVSYHQKNKNKKNKKICALFVVFLFGLLLIHTSRGHGSIPFLNHTLVFIPLVRHTHMVVDWGLSTWGGFLGSSGWLEGYGMKGVKKKRCSLVFRREGRGGGGGILCALRGLVWGKKKLG